MSERDNNNRRARGVPERGAISREGGPTMIPFCGWIYEYFYLFSQERRNSTDLRQTQNKRFMKNKNTACSCKCCCSNTSGVIKCELVVFPSRHCFRNPDALDPRLCSVRNVRQWLRKTLEAVARHRLEIWLWVLLDKYRAGLLLLPHVCGTCFVIYQEHKK